MAALTVRRRDGGEVEGRLVTSWVCENGFQVIHYQSDLFYLICLKEKNDLDTCQHLSYVIDLI